MPRRHFGGVLYYSASRALAISRRCQVLLHPPAENPEKLRREASRTVKTRLSQHVLYALARDAQPRRNFALQKRSLPDAGIHANNLNPPAPVLLIVALPPRGRLEPLNDLRRHPPDPPQLRKPRILGGARLNLRQILVGGLAHLNSIFNEASA